MRTATALTLVAIGAILTFAVRAHPSFLNLQVAGLVIMAVGLAGLLVRRQSFDWTRRRIVTRRGGSRGPVVSDVQETNFPSYVMIDPAALQSVQPVPSAADREPPGVQDLPVQVEDAASVATSQRLPSDATLIEEYVLEE